MKNSAILLFTLFSLTVFSQEFFNKKNATPEMLSIMKSTNSKEIGFLSSGDEPFDKSDIDYSVVLLKSKKTKRWGLMVGESDGSGEYKYAIEPNYDSIKNWVEFKECLILKQDDKYGVCELDEYPTKYKVRCKYDEVDFVLQGNGVVTLVRRAERWGLYQPSIDLLSYPCIEESKENVPTYHMSSYDLSLFESMKQKHQIVGYRPDGNGDGLFYACKSDRKWGLFQMDRQIIPMKYDKIEPMSWNAPFIIVYNNNKAGIYISPFGTPKMTVSCQYDELKRFKHNGYFGCAVRTGKKWAILDWYTNEMITSFDFDSFDSLTVPFEAKSKFYD